MKELKIGMQGLKGTTPKYIKTIYRIIMLISTLWVTVIQPQFHFSEHVQAVINQWVVVGNSGFYTICQFFGYTDDTATPAPDA